MGIEEVPAINPGADAAIHGDPYVARPVKVRLPGVVHQGPGHELLLLLLDIQLPQKGVAPVRLGDLAKEKSFHILSAHLHGALLTQAVFLPFLFQPKEAVVAVVAPDPEFFPAVYPIQLLQKGFIPVVVQIQAPDRILAVSNGIGIGLGQGPKPAAEGHPVPSVNQVFDLMAHAGRFHKHRSFRSALSIRPGRDGLVNHL